MSRANWYKTRRHRKHRDIDKDLVLSLVKEQRRQHPRMGVRKLREVLKLSLHDGGVSIGRDRFFDLLRDEGLLVPPAGRIKFGSAILRTFAPTMVSLIWLRSWIATRARSLDTIAGTVLKQPAV